MANRIGVRSTVPSEDCGPGNHNYLRHNFWFAGQHYDYWQCWYCAKTTKEEPVD